MIEKILYTNLDRSAERKEWFLSTMAGVGVPIEIVERVPAKDWKDYDSVEDMLIQMEKADGFGRFMFSSEMQSHPEMLSDERRGIAAETWTVCLGLRRIIETGVNTLLMHDDCSILSWQDLIECVERLPYFQVIQLQWGNWEYRLRNAVLPYDHIWNSGIQCIGNEAVVLNPPGASRMIALIQGTYEGPFNMEEMLIDHFNNRNAFHPNDCRRFVTKFIGGPRVVRSEEMV